MTAIPVETKSLHDKLRERRRARFQREQAQTELLPVRMLHKESVAARLIGLGSGKQLDNFQRCGVEELYCTCTGCAKTEVFYYNCNRKWCPLCAVRLAKLRATKLKLWAATIHQPKHLVLTMRNFTVLTRPKIRQFQKALLKLRRLKIWKSVKGGCASLEITNGKEGWHLHAHLLLDVRWLDMAALSIQWGNLVGQEFGIVKIKDCRGTDYLAEVSKYVCKGSELATWPGEQIWEFINAIKGCRFFFAFGSLFKMTADIKRQLALQRAGPRECKCGCSEFIIDTEASAVLKQIRKQLKRG